MSSRAMLRCILNTELIVRRNWHYYLNCDDSESSLSEKDRRVCSIEKHTLAFRLLVSIFLSFLQVG